MAMRRDIGLVGLTFVAVSGVLGSGWLFAPMLASHLAGPSAILAWAIGAVAMLLLAMAFAEVTALFPVAGGIARIPQFSHGRLLAMVMGWSAWAGYCSTAPIEVEASLRYASHFIPWLHTGEDGSLGVAGMIAAAVLLMVFTVINAFGVQWFARINTTMTWFKIIVPVVFVVAIISAEFTPANFTDYGGFMPYGASGVFAAVASGGIAFAFAGFRHAIDMAGEARNPQRTIPAALILALIICLVIYGGIQIAFTGAIQPDALSGGWSDLTLAHTHGPLGALAAALGILWLVSLLNVAAVVAPLGGGLVSVGSNSRLAMAMANNGVFPGLFARLNAFGVPLEALILNYFVSLVMLFAMPFGEIVALNGSALVLSFVVGPIAVIALRRLAPEAPRPFKLPAAELLAPLAFAIATLLVFWSGWDTTWRLLLLLAVGMILFLVRIAVIGREWLNPRGIYWFLPYITGLAALSYFGTYGGGIGVIPAPIDSLLTACLGLVCFNFAVQCRLDGDQFQAFLEDEEIDDVIEYGHRDPGEKFINLRTTDDK
ncbi:MAG: APC family permease [Pseudomonadota bacterium]